jgi:signal-transduction protein with cAMP-binding, CBS, and nucleotidyltransferase domain
MEELVRDLMTRGVISVDTGKSVQEAARIMVDLEVGSLVVVGPSGPMGYVTPKDVLEFVVASGDLGATPVGDICNRNIFTVDLNLPVQSALAIMADRGVKHLYVTEDGRLAGVFSIYNILDLERRRVGRVARE